MYKSAIYKNSKLELRIAFLQQKKLFYDCTTNWFSVLFHVWINGGVNMFEIK